MENLHDKLSEQMNGVHWHGRYFSAQCPYAPQTHSHGADTNPSMLVYEDGFKCTACGMRGKLEKLWATVSGKRAAFSAPNKQIHGVNWKGWFEKYDDLRGIATAGINNAKTYPILMRYLSNERRINYARYGIGWLDGFFTIPVYDAEGNIVDMVVRTPPKSTLPKYILRPSKKGEHSLYAPDWIRVMSATEIWFDFVGVFDAISMDMAGFPVLTGLRGKEAVSTYADLLHGFRKRINIVADVGEESEAKELARMLGWRGKFIPVQYPEHCKDRNDIHRLYGLETLKLCLDKQQETGKTSVKFALASS